MATAWWVGNGQLTAQVDTLTITAVLTGGTLTVTINGKSVVYTVVSGDSTTTAASNLLGLLQAATTLLPEFNEITWSNPSAGVILATAATPGTPFTLTVSNALGATIIQSHTTLNSSNSDVANPANWLRGGVAALPISGDDIILQDSDIPMLWNLNALANVRPNSVTRWQNMSGAIGLPFINASDYLEYRPRNLQFGGSGSSPSSGSPSSPGPATCKLLVGKGTDGSGPPNEYYDFQSQQVTVEAMAANELRVLGTSFGNTVYGQGGATILLGMQPTESCNWNSILMDGGSLTMGPLVTVSTLTCVSSSLELHNAPTTIDLQGVTAQIQSEGLTFASIILENGTQATWNSNSNVGSLVLKTGSRLDKSSDVRPIVVTSCSMEADTCTIADPNNSITFTNAIQLINTISSGPLQLGPGRTWKVV